VWSRHLELSYFDHPPMVAYFIRLTTLFSQSEFAIRLTAVICMTIAAWVLYKLALKLFDERIADISLLIMMFLPVTQAGYLIVTPDSPLVLFWSLTLYCIYTALWEEKRNYFIWAGICAGLLLLSKYTGILLIPAVFIFLLLSRFRTELTKKDIYITLFLAFLIFAPVVIWNAQHEWISFRFQLTHGMGGEKEYSLKHLGDFLGGQAFVANPIFMLAMLFYAIRYAKVNFRDERLLFLVLPFLFTFAFFLYGGLSKKSEANWAVPAYLTGTILLAYWISKYNRRWISYSGIALTVIMIVLMKFPEAIPGLHGKLVMKRQFMGYKEIFREGMKYTRQPGTIILSDSYQNASEARYYMGKEQEVYILSPKRISMYDFWKQDIENQHLKEAIYFGADENLPGLRNYFTSIKLIDTLRFQNKYIEREIRVYRCSNKP
ncbi:MAG: glycosyltransferase family 39 protein, partial [Armatimonadota bacterium]